MPKNPFTGLESYPPSPPRPRLNPRKKRAKDKLRRDLHELQDFRRYRRGKETIMGGKYA